MIEDSTWQTLDRHLDELLDLDPRAQAERLAEISRAAPDLAARLCRMIAGIQSTSPIENMGASAMFQQAVASLEGLAPGDRLGKWTLLRRCGSGGMADVFEATRTIAEAEQRAAIKIMAVGLDNEEQRRRFRQETRILAKLQDPRLSRLIDAGASPSGLPWMAMEYIEGSPIDRACEDLKLGLKQRVRLMIEVARAVDYCHRELVVHRDLKPSNIFVTPDGRIRLLDFGIAKVQEMTPQAAQQTATHARAFTLQFTSPEQLAGKTAGVAGDVYQLGLILYLLLTGQRAFARHELEPLKMLQAMQEGPVLPSAALQSRGSLTGSRARLERRRVRALRGDLDAIVMRALEHSPDARYPGARDFADDLKRWLDGIPVTARSYTPVYRAVRYVRRHWLGASALAVIFLLISGYALTITWQSKRLAEERNAAEQARLHSESIREFLLQVFGSVDTMSQASRGKTVEQLLIEGAERARTEFADQPRLAAQLLMDMGTVLDHIGKIEEAGMAFTEANAKLAQSLGADHPETLDTVPELGGNMYRQGQGEQALELLRNHLATVERVFGDPSDQVVAALFALTGPESVHGDIETAEALIRRARETHLALHPDAREDKTLGLGLAEIDYQLGVVLLRAARYEEASRLLTDSLVMFDTWAGRLDMRTIEARKQLGFAYRRLQRPDEARAVFEETLRDERELYDGPSWRIAYTLGHLGGLASDGGDFDESARLWQEAEDETRAAMGGDFAWIDSARFNRGRSMMLGGREAEGRALLTELIESERDEALAGRARSFLEEFDAPPDAPRVD